MKAKERREIEQLVQLELDQIYGPEPVLADYQKRVSQLERAGLFVTRLAAELIQAFGAVALVVVFALLEQSRIFNSTLAMGQAPAAARLIAVALVAGNVIHPVYSLRQHRGAGYLERQRRTLADVVRWLRWKISGEGTTEQLSADYNPTLDLAAFALTAATLLLSFYDILLPFVSGSWGDMLAQVARPGSAFQLIGGALVSVGAVFFLQSAAHEIGVRLVHGSEAERQYQHALAERQRARAEIFDRVKGEVLEVEPVTLAGVTAAPALPVDPDFMTLPRRNGSG